MADEFVVLNVPEIARALEAAPATAGPILRTAVEAWQLRRGASLARYPSPPSGSTYRRTGTLGRTWASARPTWAASGLGFESRVGNKTPYAPWVQGQKQASVHKGRWRTAQQEGDANRPELETALQGAVRAIEDAINGVAS